MVTKGGCKTQAMKRLNARQLILLMMAFLLIYLIAEGVTEGYTWARHTDRAYDNYLVRGGFNTMPNANGILDYHAWRMLECLGILGAIVSMLFLAYSFRILAIKALIGIWIFGNAIYEFCLSYIVFGKLIVQRPDFAFMWLSIPRYKYEDIIKIIVGLTIIVYILVKVKAKERFLT